jgi:hypothetical protein
LYHFVILMRRWYSHHCLLSLSGISTRSSSVKG